jgi:hypothetical protein
VVDQPKNTKTAESPRNVNLEELSIAELKVLAYDELVVLERTQNNLNILRSEISKRKQEDK